MMFSAKIDICSKEPPVNALRELKASPLCCENQLEKVTPVHTRNRNLRPQPDYEQHHEGKEKSLFLKSSILNAFRNVRNIRSPRLFHQAPRS